MRAARLTRSDGRAGRQHDERIFLRRVGVDVILVRRHRREPLLLSTSQLARGRVRGEAGWQRRKEKRGRRRRSGGGFTAAEGGDGADEFVFG